MTRLPRHAAALPLVAAASALAACSDAPSAPAAPPERPTAALVSGGGGGTTPPINPCSIVYCPPGGGSIVAGHYYQGNPNLGEHTGYNLVLLTSDGTIQRRLTDANEWDYLPALSPDRKKVAFGSTRHGGSVYVVNTDGTGLKLLAKVDSATMQHVAGVSWSPDGTKVLFSGKVGGQYDLFLVKPDGTGLTKVTNDAAEDLQAVFTPDGQNIVMASTRGTGATPNRELWRITTAGASVQRLTYTAGDERTPSFSPDGTKLLYQRVDWSSASQGLYLADASGANPVAILTKPTTKLLGYPSFSPDGKWVSYMLEESVPPFRDAIWRLALASPATEVRVTPADQSFGWPRWSN